MYIRRGTDSEIVAISKQSVEGFDEQVAEDDAELQLFLKDAKSSRQQTLETSDLHMVRVLEDVINLLIERNVIRFTDLPSAAQGKLLSRRALREAVNLLDDEDDNIPL
jgi:hypothetical protein